MANPQRGAAIIGSSSGSSAVARHEATRRAQHIVELDQQFSANENELAELVQSSDAASLLQENGF